MTGFPHLSAPIRTFSAPVFRTPNRIPHRTHYRGAGCGAGCFCRVETGLFPHLTFRT